MVVHKLAGNDQPRERSPFLRQDQAAFYLSGFALNVKEYDREGKTMSLAETIAHALGNGKERKSGDGWLTCCPAHGDENPSLSIKDGTDNSGNPDVSIHCHAGCDFKDVKDELRAKELLPEWKPEQSQDRPINRKRKTAGVKKDNLPAHIWKQSKKGTEAEEVIKTAFAFRRIDLKEIPPNMRLNEYKGKLSIAC
ncbi:MAG: hypothetical protein D3925_04235, partial [Candidatus Electrothrix sp. AR5]|nr:hypothetical protein [Candidatus Electrothrix sp. AR5]